MTTGKLDMKKWQKDNGETRWYVNNWQDIIGLEVETYKTGNPREVYLMGGLMSNTAYRRIRNTKVWIDEDEGIHIDYCDDGTIRKLIKEEVAKAMEE